MDEWDIDAGKHLILEMSHTTKEWSDWLVVQKPFFFLPDLLFKFRSRFYKYLKGYYKLKSINENTTLITPKIPFHFAYWLTNALFKKIDLLFIKFRIGNVIKNKYKDSIVILWLYMPKLYPITKILSHDKLIYYIQDNYIYDADTGKLIMPDYDINIELIKESSIIFSTSEVMYKYARKYNQNTYYMPNGNNYEILSSESNALRTELDSISKPIIGYLGGIRCWIDFKLVEMMLQNLKNCYVVFLVPLNKNAADDLKILLTYNNFIWIRFKEQWQLPAYLKKFRVGIIPFKINNFMLSVFPNKFFEYMALGIPIVTTALPELKKYSDLIGYSETNEEFIDNCKYAVNGKFDSYRYKYIELAKSNTWELRAHDIDHILLNEIGN